MDFSYIYRIKFMSQIFKLIKTNTMKKAIIVVLFTLITGMTYSQDYYPLVVEDNTWNVMAVGLFPYWDTAFSTVTYKLSGDTVINSLTYKKMLSSWEEIPVNWNLYGFMREDDNRQVWLKTEFVTQEFLMYDFLAEQGDTVTVGLQTPVNLIVDSITSVTVSGTERYKFWLSGIEYTGYHETWIEGIGSDKGIVWSGSAGLTGGYYVLLCMSNNGEQIYMNPDYNFCYINTVSIDENIGESIQIYPIPATNSLKFNNINNLDIISISIIDFSGRVIRDFEANSSVVDISTLNSGIYFLRIKTENGEILKKVVKN
jgi:hypothetical protein